MIKHTCVKPIPNKLNVDLSIPTNTRTQVSGTQVSRTCKQCIFAGHTCAQCQDLSKNGAANTTIPSSPTGTFLDELNFLELLNKTINDKVSAILETKKEEPYESPSTKNICEALSKAQGEFPPILYTRQHPHVSLGYADLNEIMNKIRPSLAKNGLSITTQTIITQEGHTILHTRLRHSCLRHTSSDTDKSATGCSDTGASDTCVSEAGFAEWIETRVKLHPKNDERSYTSALMFMRRHQIMSLLNITTIDNLEDDDGEGALFDKNVAFAKGTALNRKYNPKNVSTAFITVEQLDELQYTLSPYPDIAEQLLTTYKIDNLADLPKNLYRDVMEHTRKIIAIRENAEKKRQASE